MKPINLAAIDIGSNGARLLIKRFDDNAPDFERIRKLMFIRVPLRLGNDVFTLGKISKHRAKIMLHMMKGFKQFMLVNDVTRYRACATSAMRDAENGKKVMRLIEEETGIKLEIIPGAEEAQLLCNNLVENTESGVGNFAYVDVGGGSTEISLLHDGILAESHSFNIGTLRLLSGNVKSEERKQMKSMLESYARDFPDTRIIGSGGNINKLFKLVKDKNSNGKLKVGQLHNLYNQLSQLTSRNACSDTTSRKTAPMSSCPPPKSSSPSPIACNATRSWCPTSVSPTASSTDCTDNIKTESKIPVFFFSPHPQKTRKRSVSHQ